MWTHINCITTRNLQHTSIWWTVFEILSISPTMYKVALAGKYQRSWNFLILSASHFLICSSNPIGNLLLSLFSECRCCNNYIQKNFTWNYGYWPVRWRNEGKPNHIFFHTWQSTRYSIVFIICSSESMARRSFSIREERNFGWKAICRNQMDTKYKTQQMNHFQLFIYLIIE